MRGERKEARGEKREGMGVKSVECWVLGVELKGKTEKGGRKNGRLETGTETPCQACCFSVIGRDLKSFGFLDVGF